jgi:hypothetical protein
MIKSRSRLFVLRPVIAFDFARSSISLILFLFYFIFTKNIIHIFLSTFVYYNSCIVTKALKVLNGLNLNFVNNSIFYFCRGGSQAEKKS